jgi:gliding motility-associated-like protein
MKTILVGLSFLVLFSTIAQTSAEQYVLGAAGGETVTSGGDSYMYNIGEVVVTTAVSSGSINLTQGFEQPESLVSDIILFDPPNAFSPDGDGVNDTWILPLPAQFLNNVRVVIFNRWGDEVAVIEEYNNMDNVWDGTYSVSGEQVTSGTFFYIVESTNYDKKYSGWIQVVR